MFVYGTVLSSSLRHSRILLYSSGIKMFTPPQTSANLKGLNVTNMNGIATYEVHNHRRKSTSVFTRQALLFLKPDFPQSHQGAGKMLLVESHFLSTGLNHVSWVTGGSLLHQISKPLFGRLPFTTVTGY